MDFRTEFVGLIVSFVTVVLFSCSGDFNVTGDVSSDDDGTSNVDPDSGENTELDLIDPPPPSEIGDGGDTIDQTDPIADPIIDSTDEDAVQTVGVLGDEILICEGRNPHIASDSGGNPHIVFDRRGDGVFYARGSGTGGEFPAEPDHIGPAGSIEPQVFIDEDDWAHVVWAHSPGGSNVGGVQGWYTNNIGGSWKEPIMVSQNGDGDNGDGGMDRITNGRVVKIPGRDLAITSWSGQQPKNLLVSIDGLSDAPAVVEKVRADRLIPGLVALPSSVRTVYRTPQGERATDYDLDLDPLTPNIVLIDVAMSGECGDGFLEAGTGLVHYTGTAAGNSNSRVWYNNDDRIEHGMEALEGRVVAELGATGYYWADVCVDVLGQAYITHSYIDTERGPCTEAACNSYLTYVQGETLVSVELAPGYSANRVGPYCSPAPSGGIHITYHLEDPYRVFYRTADVP